MRSVNGVRQEDTTSSMSGPGVVHRAGVVAPGRLPRSASGGVFRHIATPEKGGNFKSHLSQF